MKQLINHGLDAALARKVVDAAFQSYLERFARFQPVLSWADTEHATVTFSAKGMGFTGRFALLPGALQVDMEVPAVFALLKKQAVKAVEEEVGKWVDLARAGKIP
jgi:hypothetical protein